MYELCVLGGPPQNKYVWSYCTRRYGVIYSFICGLVRHAYLAGIPINDINFILPNTTKDELIDKHFQWLMSTTKEYISGIKDDKEKQMLLLNGLSLVNIMDVGVNKAIYEFLPILSLFCRKSVWLNFFSLERDGMNLSDLPVVPSSSYGARKDDAVYMRQRSRLNYLLQFAALNEQTVMITTSKTSKQTNSTEFQKEQVKMQICDQAEKYKVKLNKEWMHIALDDDESLEVCTEEIQGIITKMQKYQKRLPLRWVFLRSLVISLQDQPMILHKLQILNEAKKLNMEEKEVDEFLTTFSDYGSILYMPQFGNLVIVDIWKFLIYLDNHFYPSESQSHASNLQKYGIITKTAAKKILNGEEENFMKLLTGFGLAAIARIKNEGSVHIPGEQPHSTFECYYIPRARVIGEYKPCQRDNNFAFIEINAVHFPADILTSICHKIIKLSNDMFL